jgi:CheY-like chemotaxis protein
MTKLDFSDKQVLVIDDQKPFLGVLKSMLNSLGTKSVITANHCDAAIKCCEEIKFDFIICDLHFGENRKNGFQFLEEINLKKLTKTVTVFVMASADAERPMVLGSIEKYPDEYLVKPFSRAQLELRLTKQYYKKTALLKIFEAIQNEQLELAISFCKQQLKNNTAYQETCIKLLTKLYWKTAHITEAKELLTALPKSKSSYWINVSLAQTEYLLGNYQDAVTIAKKVILKNKLFVDAHDIMAASYLKLDKKREAFYSIEKALYFSPHSLERNFKACDIARKNRETSNIVNYSRQIWELSKHSIHHDVAHLCSHLRSFLDFSEEVSDPATKSRLQQESFAALNKYKSDTSLLFKQNDFDSKIYQSILSSRVQFQNNQLQQSRNTFHQVQLDINEKYPDFPLIFAADSIKVLLDLGEFEQASELCTQYFNSEQMTDSNTLASINSYNASSQQPQIDYFKFNKLAISLFSQHQYSHALEAFIQAQSVAPANSAIALNLLKCKLRLIEISPSPQIDLVNSCRQTFNTIKNMTMLDSHKSTFEKLKVQAQKVLVV